MFEICNSHKSHCYLDVCDCARAVVGSKAFMLQPADFFFMNLKRSIAFRFECFHANKQSWRCGWVLANGAFVCFYLHFLSCWTFFAVWWIQFLDFSSIFFPICVCVCAGCCQSFHIWSFIFASFLYNVYIYLSCILLWKRHRAHPFHCHLSIIAWYICSTMLRVEISSFANTFLVFFSTAPVQYKLLRMFNLWQHFYTWNCFLFVKKQIHLLLLR